MSPVRAHSQLDRSAQYVLFISLKSLATFREFPPRQSPASFSIDQALEKARQNQKAMATSGGAGVK